MARHRLRLSRPLLALRSVLVAVTVAGAAVAVTAVVSNGNENGHGDGGAAPVAVPAPAGLAVQLDGAPVSATAVGPRALRVPAIGVASPLPALGVDASGALVPPEDTATAGWFAGGPAPGQVGPAVVAGHVDSYRGPGVFFRLHDLRAGDDVLVDRADGTTLRFTVTRVERYPKDHFPTAEVYGPTPDAELRLITCGGAFDRAARSYVDDVVVFARQA